MKKIIVSDASPLIALAKLDLLELLFVSFTEVHLPQAVYSEATHDRYREDSKLIHHFIHSSHQQNQAIVVHKAVHKNRDNKAYAEYRNILGEGESQALALVDDLGCGLLIDERLGRKIARLHDIPVVGVMGVLLQAKSKGKIHAIQPLIEQLLENNYRLSERVIELVLRKAKEL